MIKLEQLDPDWEFAARHGQASLVGYNRPSKNNGSTALCPCCLQLIYKQQIPLSVSSKQLQFLGFGFPLFYTFLKNCMILLIILICTYNALSIRKAVDHNYYFCHGTDPNVEPHRRVLASESKGPTCTTFMIELARIQQTVPVEEQIIRIASFILQILYLIYMRDNITKLESYYDERNTSLSDYAVMIKNIPKQPNIQLKLKQFFKRGFANSHEIKQTTLLPEYPEIEFLQKERIKTIDKLREAYNKGEFTEQDTKLQAALQKIEQSIHQEALDSKRLADKDQLQCEKVILVFNTDQEKSQILQEFQDITTSTKGQFFGIGAEEMRIKEAPQPKQILWQNVNVSQQKKIILYLLSWGLSALVLILVTIFFYFILQQKTLYLIESLAKIQKDKNNKKYISNYNSAVALAYIMLFLIIFFNKLVMSTLFYKFTELERQETRSKFQFSFGLKYLLGLFFTTALMTLAVQAIRFDNYYAHPYGVIQEETIMFFLNAFFTPLFWLFNPFGLLKRLKRKLYFGKRGKTQQQANHLMESSHYDMGKRYAEVIQTMWFTFLYATLIPLGAFLSLAGIIIYFWVDKYTLLRKSSLGREVSGKIVLPNLKLLDVTLVLKAAGEMLFDIQIRHSYALASTIVMLVISILYILIPVGRIIEWFNPESFNLEQKSYQQVKQSFKDTYHTEHPVYKLIHGEKLKRKLSKKGLILSNSQTLQTLNSGKHQKTEYPLFGKKIDSTTHLKQNNALIDSQTSKELERKNSANKIGSMRF